MRISSRRLLFLGLATLFALLLFLALGREVYREIGDARLSVNALLRVSEPLLHSGKVNLLRTDRLAIFLVDGQKPVAMKIISPLLLPQAVQIGQKHATEQALVEQSLEVQALVEQSLEVQALVVQALVVREQKEYLLVAITDKDGDIFQLSPGEAYGSTTATIGDKKVPLLLTEEYRGGLFNQGYQSFTISGVADTKLPYQPSPDGRLIVMLFDTKLQQPIAFSITDNDRLPQPFSISLPLQLHDNHQPAYQLRILTDKNQQPFQSAPGEIIGRSAEAVPLGTTQLRFWLDMPYRRK